MIYGVFAIKDTLVGFMQPFIQLNKATAVREFKHIINGSSHVADNFENMELYSLGTFNQDTGELTSCVSFVCKGVDVKEVVSHE